MAYLNEHNIIGNLGNPPEARMTASGKRIVQFSVATSKRWRKEGVPKERVVWHRVITFGRTAEFVSEYVQKGALVRIASLYRHGG